MSTESVSMSRTLYCRGNVTFGQTGAELTPVLVLVGAMLPWADLTPVGRQDVERPAGQRRVLNVGGYTAAAAAEPWTALAALRITSSTSSGCESIGTWLLSTS